MRRRLGLCLIACAVAMLVVGGTWAAPASADTGDTPGMASTERVLACAPETLLRRSPADTRSAATLSPVASRNNTVMSRPGCRVTSSGTPAGGSPVSVRTLIA